MEFDDIDETALRARRGKKWSAHDADVLPAWVADMDFLPARPIRESLARMAETGDLGYGEGPATDPLRKVFAERCARRYHWPVAAERVELISDVVHGLYLSLDAFTQPGQGAVVFTPIYPPFLQAVRETGRRAVLQPLVRGSAGFAMDLEALAAAVAYLRGNRELLGEWLTERLPGIDYRPPEATYLAWLDCRALQLPEPPGRYFLRHARVALSEGADFGAPGEGHVRLNFATSRPILERILERMEVALRNRNTVAGEVPGT